MKSAYQRKAQLDFRRALEPLSFRDLNLFEGVARHQSLSAAAKDLGVRAPFLTKCIQRMESELGRKLLLRTYNGISLSSDGREFLEFCRQVIAKVDESEWKKTSQTQVPVEFMNLAGPLSLMAHVVAPSAALVLQNHQVGLRMLEMRGTDFQSALSRQHIDAFVHWDRLDLGRAWKSFPVGVLEWVLCARKNHPLTQNVTSKELLKYPFILPTSLGAQGFVLGNDFCELSPTKRMRSVEVSNGDIGLRMLENSDHVIFLPALQARELKALSKIRVIEVKDWAPIRKMVQVTVQQDRVKQNWLNTLIVSLEKKLATL